MAFDQPCTALSQALREHVWQGRFKSFPVQRDEHLQTVLRYVLQNPVRSGLAASVNDWPWSSWCRSELVDPCPVEVESNWITKVEEPLSTPQLASIRESVNRQTFWGNGLADENSKSFRT
jgi:putative transposase